MAISAIVAPRSHGVEQRHESEYNRRSLLDRLATFGRADMRLTQAGLVAASMAALSVSTNVTAFAQPYCFESSVRTSDGARLTVTMEDGWNMACWADPVAGVDIYRSTLGTECGELVRITEIPLPWKDQPSRHEPYLSVEVVDAAALPNTAYRYFARAVDAQRNPVPGNPDAEIGMATTGEALVAHGRLVTGPGCSGYETQLVGCAEECFSYVRFSNLPAEVRAYVNSPTTLLVYGEVVTARDCNFLAPFLSVTRAVPAACALGVESLTWGAVKRLYHE